MRWGSVGSVVAGLGVLALLTGCGAGASDPGRDSRAGAGIPSPPPSATPTPTPSVFLGTGVSLRYSCDELVGPVTIAKLDADLVENPAYTPAATTSAERAVAIRGTACQWLDRATGTSLIVTAAHPDPPTLGDLMTTTAGYATRTTAFGSDVTGYAVNTQMEIFVRGYWATATSPLFTDPSKARAVMTAVADSLPVG